MSDEGRPRVLVVDDNPRARTLVRLGLELEGLEVVEAASIAEGRKLLDSAFDGYVLDRQLPDGDGLTLVPDVRRGAPVVIYSTLEAIGEPAGVTHVDKGDLPGVIEALGLTGHDIVLGPLRAAGIVRDETDELVGDWRLPRRLDPDL